METFKRLAKEIVPIIAGILIALLINNWNEDRKSMNYLAGMLLSIDRELQQSIVEIESTIPQQLASIDTIEAYMNDDSVSLYGLLMRSNGINFPSIKTNTWNAIANSRMELISFERLSAFAEIQDRKDNLIMRNTKQMDYVFENIESKEKSKKMIFRMIAMDIVNAEQELLEELKLLTEK